MTTSHIDQLNEWWREAERGPISPGDTLIQHHPSDDTEYTVYVATEASTDSGNFVRILARAPKPAWHDALAVIARYENSDTPQTFLRAGHLWIDRSGGKYTTEVLRDVTPLIEAKVTDEMVDLILDVIDARFDNYPAGIGEELATAALGLETE